MNGSAIEKGEEREPPMKLRRMGQRQAAPLIEPASDDGLKAIQHMKLPAGFEVSLWAAEPMLANPVAFTFDERGRVFVAEAHRFSSSVPAITSYMQMLEEDLACRTIEDRLAMVRRNFGEAGIKELSIESDIIRVLEDKDGDGKADASSIYVDDFRAPLDGLGSGVLARQGKVWYANIPSLWLLTGEAKAATRTELSRGYGVRYNYAGHDLHGLVFGPDGKIYYSIGDRGAHVPTKEGGLIDVPDTGAVFRCNPDGTELELYAWGLRNPQSLLFNEFGDLFTGDNDSDQGDEERLVHVVEGGDSGWRIGYQFSPLGNGGPLNREKLWMPRHTGQPAYFLAGICNIEDGPSGIAYYPGTGFGDAYRDTLFIAHYKGAVARSGVYSYKLSPQGASYAVTDSRPFVSAALPTDVRFGPDGALYFSDWGLSGWSKSKRGRLYAVKDAVHARDPLVLETKALLVGDWTKRTDEDLAALLAHADGRVRQEAQFALAERGISSVPVFASVATNKEGSPLARRHAIWGLGQLAARTSSAVLPLRTLLSDSDPEVQAQALKVLGDCRDGFMGDAFVAALKNENNRVKFFAAQAIGRIRHAAAVPALLAALRANDDQDEYLRHALVMGLVGANNVEAFAAASGDDSRAVRMGTLLALRRLVRPEVRLFLNDQDELLRREAAIAINDEPINEALPDLAKWIEAPVDDEPLMLRVLNANFRLGGAAKAGLLATYAARSDVPAALRAEALGLLAQWPEPPARDRIVGVFRPLEQKTRDAGEARLALEKIIPTLLDAGTPEGVQEALLNAMSLLKVELNAEALLAVIDDPRQPAGTQVAVLGLLERADHPQLGEAVRRAGESAVPALRLAALPLASRLFPDLAAPLISRLADSADPTEQKAAFNALVPFRHATADDLLRAQVRKLAEGKLSPAVQLELREAVAARNDPAALALLKAYDDRLTAGQDSLSAFQFALEGGDSKRGRRLFNDHPVLACARCHRVGPETGGDAGPDLSGIGVIRDRAYLLESILQPNARIAPGFDMVVLSLESGASVAGLLVKEDEVSITLRDYEGKITVVKKAGVKTRERAPSAMPEIYRDVLKKTELRDLVEYLASLKSSATTLSSEPVPRALRGVAGH